MYGWQAGSTHPTGMLSCLPSNYRPQMKFAKVMFLQVSVCPQGGHAWLGRGVCMPGGVHGWGHAWLEGGMCGWGVCMAGGLHSWGVCVAGGGCVWHAHTMADTMAMTYGQ